MNLSSAEIFERLMAVLHERREADPEQSYVARLYRDGLPAINAKILEEAEEVVHAAGGDSAHLCHEIADLWFHTLVLLAHQGLTVEDIAAELQRRFGTSGLEEKAQRNN